MYQIWIDTGGTFTDGLALDPTGILHRAKVLSSSRLRGQLINGKLIAPWLTAPIFDGYKFYVSETGEEYTIISLQTNGLLILNRPINSSSTATTVELFTGEEAPVLAARLLTQTPVNKPFPPLEMRLGTTKGTNALLEKKGGRVALLVTKGFKDLLKIGTQQRPDLFQLAIPPAEVLYDSVLEVDERLTANGQILTPLSDQTIAEIVKEIRQIKPDAVAVSLLNAYRNPIHEQQLYKALATAGFDYITCSTSVSTAPQYVSRTQTAVVDAYLMPVMRSYLDNVQQQLGGDTVSRATGSLPMQSHQSVRNYPVRIMTSAGGLVRADLFQPKDSLLSGPAGGVIGAAAISHNQPVLTLDMGGTSTDVSRIQGSVDYRFSTKIGPFTLQLPSLAIETVAAGGGSICWFDGTQLRVGPQSAGANPGPACYGANTLGETPLLTITDVNLLAGKLHAKQFGIPVFPEKAQEALAEIIRQIGATGTVLSSIEILRGFEHIANETMAGAIRKVSVARGFDPKDYNLLVFGGAGGLHGCAIARLLGMERLILPFDGGLLSAYGIGQAQIERMSTQSILQPLATIENELHTIRQNLIDTATEIIRQDVGPDVAITTKSISVFLRLSGQEATIDVPFSDHLANDFVQKYQHLYGHFPADTNGKPRPIEVESMRVLISTVGIELPVSDSPVSHRHAVPSFETDTYPAYDWTQLQEGDTFRGPALLLNTTASAFIEHGWRLVVQADKNALVDYIADLDESIGSGPNEVIQLELFTQRFRAIAEEMGAQLQRTAFSVNVKERFDFSCALLNANAELVANAPHVPVHLGSLGICARLVLGKMAIRPGDVIITNHPKYGGSHLPDITLLSGVFTNEKPGVSPQLIGYVINRAHHAEIGGKVPGSMPPDAVSLVEEGVVLEPMYLVKEGEFRWKSNADTHGVSTYFTDAPYPTRALTENQADIEAALASLKSGEIALRTLVDQHSLATVQHYMARLQQSASDAISAILQPLNGQTFEAEESLDDGYIIHVKIMVVDGQITFDFSGTSGVHPHNLNANISILYSAVLYVLRLWCNTDIPLNEGLMAPVKLILPESSFLNPIFPDNHADGRPADFPAVVGGNTEVSQRLVDTLLKALGLAACSQGTMNNFLFGNETFGYYETIGGGAGATIGADGRSAVHQHMTNTKLTDPEELERRYPVRLHQFSIRDGSRGDGKWGGAMVLCAKLSFWNPFRLHF